MSEKSGNNVDLHELCSNNREQLLATGKCVCGYCFKEFNANKIKEWVDNDETALCPHCNIDAVFPKTEEITQESLVEFNEIWFKPIFESSNKHNIFKD